MISRQTVALSYSQRPLIHAGRWAWEDTHLPLFDSRVSDLGFACEQST